MIYEYAVEPALVAGWAKNREIGLAPQFGLDQRRVVSDFPMNWEGEVTGELLESYGHDSGDPDYIDAQAYLNGLLSFMKAHMPDRAHRSTDETWLVQALRSHKEEPFHAILARESSEKCEQVITPDVVHQLRDQRWYLPTIDVAAKTAEALADRLEPLLRAAKDIILVDPYFAPQDSEYREVLHALVDRALRGRSHSRARPNLTVMSGVADRDRPASTIPIKTQLLNEANNRCRQARKWLGQCLPTGMNLTFLCIEKFAGGDQVHNRFLLTDSAGACFPYGTQPLGMQVFDDITPLFAGQYRARWQQYGRRDGLQIVGNVELISGERT